MRPGFHTVKVRDQDTIRALLDLADDPRHDVASTSDEGRMALVVPDYLYERYLRYLAIDSSPPTEPKKSGRKK